MVQRLHSHRIPCRPIGVATKNIDSSNDDDSNKTQSLSNADDALLAASMPPLKNFMDHCNPQVCEIIYRLNSGKVFRMTRAQPDAQEIHIGDLPLRPCHLSTLEALESQHRSGRRKTRNLPRAGPHCRTPRRKRRDSSSTTSPLPTKRQSVRKRRAGSYSDSESESDSDSEDEDKDETVLLDGIETEMKWIKVSDLHLEYYTTAIRSINQLCCKDILKAWIRLCHPKKQTTHPYNGGKTGRRSKSEFRYQGHYTAPDYWPSDEHWDGLPVPSGCRHKEPDHVKKPERIILLVHLLGSQDKGFKDGDFSLEKLIQSTNNIHLLEKKQHWTSSHVEKLQEIYRVRAKEMEFERNEIDGDTLVNVQMPKLRCKARKASQSTVKAATSLNKLLEKDSKEADDECFRAQDAPIPIANMGINAQSEDECVSSGEGSEPSIPAPATSAEEIAPDISGPESITISCKVPTVQRDLPFSALPPAMTTRLNCVQDAWAPHQADIGQDSTSREHPNTFGTVMTAGEAQPFLPSHEDYPSKSSSIESFPSQVKYPQYDHESTAPQRVARGMLQNDTFSIVPKVEIVRRPAFAASSSGLVGAFAIDAQYSSWQTDNLWHAPVEPSIYTAVADPTIGLLPPTNGSFSSGYSDASSGLPLETWNTTPGHQGPVQEGLNLQGAATPWHLPLGLRTSSCGSSNMASRSSCNTDFGTRSSLMAESNFGPYFQDQQQR